MSYSTNIRNRENEIDIFNTYPDLTGSNVYDAYEKDIARVEFYFDTPTVFQVNILLKCIYTICTVDLYAVYELRKSSLFSTREPSGWL